MNESPDKKKYLLQEKPWILANEEHFFEKRKSSQGCDILIAIHGDKVTCGTFTIPPKTRLGRISAHASDETYYVLTGTLKVDLPRLGETISVKKGEFFYMPGGMIHAPFNDEDEECVVVWHSAPDWP